jgi:hypothetical protein
MFPITPASIFRLRIRPIWRTLGHDRTMTSPPRPAGAPSVAGGVAALLGSTGCLIGCVIELSALGRGHGATAVPALLGIAFGALAVALLRVAIGVEHRYLAARRDSAAALPIDAPAVVPGGGRVHVSGVIAVLMLLVAAAALAGLSASLYSNGQRSQFTQHHGVPRQARVTAADSVSHTAKHDSWTTYDYDISLLVPVAGRTASHVEDPTRDTQVYGVGKTMSVLVDPREPGYSEVPGEPVQSRWWFIAPLVMAMFFLGLAVAETVKEIRHRRPATRSR